ncbi:AMP-binding protein [Streptomyces sp. NPDC059783]|uniref:AMP-binding protein n=1 Tax=Streptomyces sp. NPDC059783 TaxID=3346944 RepID=UPI003654BB4F
MPADTPVFPHRGPVTGPLTAAAGATPHAVAVTDPRTSWSHRRLHRAAGLLAARLAATGVRRGDPVGVALPKSCELLAAYLAVWRRGAYTVLLDPAWPPARTEAALRAAGAPAVVIAPPGTPCAGARVLGVGPGDLDHADDPAHDGGDPEDAGATGGAPHLHPDALAYAVLTSGSTGEPKAVAVTHRSVAHSTATHGAAHRVVPGDRSAWMAPPGASSAVGEIWPYLAAGASVVVPPEDTTASPAATRRWILEQGVTTAYVSMPLAERLHSLDWPEDTPLRLMTVGSDVVRRWARPHLPFEVAVSFGSAEANGISSSLTPWPERITSHTASPALRAARPPVGRPWPDVTVRVTTPGLREAAPGHRGELTVSGPEIALGYLGDPARTAVRFVPDPFGTTPGARLYRTGDLCTLPEDGLLRHHGRTDRQIKIRGHRVDPAEVEAVLLDRPGVTDAVVTAEPGPDGTARLAAHLVAAPDVTAGQLRTAAAAALPAHAVPAVWTAWAELPRTANGKVARDLLATAPGARPLPAGPAAAPPAASGTGEADGRLLEPVLAAWREALRNPACSADDDFFDLGGDSLTAAVLTEALAEDLGLRVRLRDVFTRPTPRRLAAHLTALAAPSPQTVPAGRNRT